MSSAGRPASPTVQRLVEEVVGPLLRRARSLDAVPVDRNLSELNVDSMLLVQVIVRTEEVFGVELPLDLLDSLTVTRLAALVDEQRDPQR